MLRALECCKAIIDDMHSLAGVDMSAQAQAVVSMAFKTTPCGFLLPTIIAACGPAATRAFAPCSAQLLTTLESMVKSADALATVLGDQQVCRSLDLFRPPRQFIFIFRFLLSLQWLLLVGFVPMPLGSPWRYFYFA